jgi:filamentous hemagglutinin
VLNPANPQNGGRAEWFKQALGFTQENWGELAKQVVFNPKKATLSEATEYGTKYLQNTFIKGANGKTIETTFVFIKDATDNKIRLVTTLPRAK